jgi:hypothetical protein
MNQQITDITDAIGSVRAAVRAWAAGTYPAEAAVELLIRMPKSPIREQQPWLVEDRDRSDRRPRTVAVDADALAAGTAAWSGGEQRVIAVAVSLLTGRPVSLGDVVTGVDCHHLQLVLAAIAHAAGSHEDRLPVFGDDSIVGFDQPGSLYPWPAPIGPT